MHSFDYLIICQYFLFFKRAEERAALGLPPEGDEDDELHDHLAHFSHHDDDEEDHGPMEKNKISWSYSNYMAALEKEDILNNTDESTFGSLINFGKYFKRILIHK